MQDWLLKGGNATVLGKLEGTIGGGGWGVFEKIIHRDPGFIKPLVRMR